MPLHYRLSVFLYLDWLLIIIVILLVKNYVVDIVWFLGVVLFFIHCRFFSNLEYGKTKIIFVRERFFKLKIKLRLIFLWLSRLLFIILILNRFYR